MSRVWRCLVLALLFSALIAGLSSCRKSLRAPVRIDPAIEKYRSNHEKDYPEDPFLPAIKRSEIHLGMSPLQVFLAWGRPVQRRKGDHEQMWIYEFSDDPEAQPKTIAHVFFEDELLVRWKMDRGYVYFVEPDAGGVSADDFGDLPDAGSAKQPDR